MTAFGIGIHKNRSSRVVCDLCSGSGTRLCQSLFGIVHHQFFTKSINEMLGAARDDKLIRILARELHRIANHITPQTARRTDNHCIVLVQLHVCQRNNMRIFVFYFFHRNEFIEHPVVNHQHHGSVVEIILQSDETCTGSLAGSLDDVGLFNAGFTIVNTYVGLVFTAMATDYYPRLSAIASDNDSFVRAINQQAEISLLLLAPIIIAFIAYIRVAVVVLYSTKFIPTEGMMYWAMAAMFFKAMAWSMSYGLLAKGDSKVYFWNEFITVCYGLIFNMIGYYYWGLIGLGISSFIKYGFYFLQLWIICRIKCNLKFTRSIMKLFILFSCITAIVLTCKILMFGWSGYAVVTVFLVLTTYYSYTGLDRRIGIRQVIINKLHRKN